MKREEICASMKRRFEKVYEKATEIEKSKLSILKEMISEYEQYGDNDTKEEILFILDEWEDDTIQTNQEVGAIAAIINKVVEKSMTDTNEEETEAEEEIKIGLDQVTLGLGRELKESRDDMDEIFQAINENMEKGNRNLFCQCSCCKTEGIYLMDKAESKTLERYWVYGRQLGYIQDLFPNVPAWIRSGAIDQYSNNFCICPKCCEGGDVEN